MSSPQTTPTESTTTSDTTAADLEAVVGVLRDRDRFLVTAHENPDGDALGSLLAMQLALRQLGKDSVMYLGGPAPLPGEYRFLALDDLRRELPSDAGERVLVAVDCANESRIGTDPEVLHGSPFTVNIDHHHDNTRFGDVDLVVATASSTGELLADLFERLVVRVTPEIAEPLYTALVTDTGRFQYANTTPKSLRLAADLVEAGADVHRVFQGVYESVQFAKLKLLARALERAAVYEGGRLVISYLLRTDFGEVGAAEPYSEGIIDYLRAVEGADMAALIREPPRGGTPARRVSLRSSVDELDVSAIARKSGSGGGHRQAAGFSSDESIEEITAFIVAEFRVASEAADASRRAEPGSTR
jgi:bifunctional oligoribonuclease and PAP phosphatase NrnA